MVSTRQLFSSGNWIVSEGREEEFIARWLEFLKWTRDNAPGFEKAQLIRDAESPRHFISFAEWDGLESLTAWRSLAEFSSKLGACRALCDDFRGVITPSQDPSVVRRTGKWQ